MRKWLDTLFRGPFSTGLVLSIFGALIAVELAPADGPVSEPRFYVTTGALEPEADENIQSVEIGRHAGASSHHLRVRKRVKAHLHRVHDETVVILGGTGRMTIDGVTRDIEAGHVLVLPRGTVHSLEVTGEPVEAVSIFSPPFDGQDRHFVE